MGDCMVEMKQIELANKTVLGIQLLLPNMTIFMIVYKYHILCDESFHLLHRLDKTPTISGMQVALARRFDDLLDQPLIFVSQRTKREGIYVPMTGRDALEKLP